MSSTEPSSRLVVNVEDDSEPLVDAADPTEVIAEASAAQPPPAVRRARRWLGWLPRTGIVVWIGLAVTGAGFILLAFTWGKTAALVDVAAQIPYLVSGGLVGLGLILVGLLVVNLAVKRREAADRQRQLEELREAVAGLRAAIEGEPDEQ